MLHRRTFLRGLGGTALALPFLAAMEGRGLAAGGPKRLIIVFSPNGTVRSDWIPPGMGTTFSLGALSPILSPLAAYKDRMLVVDGLDQDCSYVGPATGEPHGWIQTVITGRPRIQGANNFPSGGISLDQFLAGELVTSGVVTAFPSLEIGVQSLGSMSQSGPASPVPRETDPQSLFDKLFSNLGAGDPVAQDRRVRRKRILDAVRGDASSLRSRLAGEDQHRLDGHLQGIDDLEKQIDALVAASCEPPGFTAPSSPSDPDQLPAVSAAFLGLAAKALACDLTRIVTIQYKSGLAGNVFSWLGHTEGHHSLSHKSDSDAAAQQQLTEINAWYAGQIALLCDELASMPEGGGSVLDNTVILWVNELDKGNAHSRQNMPFLLIGDGQGSFDPGRYVSYDRSHNDLLVSVANAMLGTDVGTFGDPAFCTGPLSGL